MYKEFLLAEIITDPNNLLSFPADNLIVSTCEFWGLIGVKNIDYQLYDKAIYSCILRGYYPLIARSPNIQDCSQHDNFIGVVALCSLMNSRFIARDLYEYGSNNWFIYYPTRNWHYFHQGYQVGYYKVCAGMSMGIINYLWFLGMMFLTARQKPQETSSKKLVVLMGYRLKQSRWFAWIYRWFEKQMDKQYGQYWYSEILKIYYGEDSNLYKFARLECGR